MSWLSKTVKKVKRSVKRMRHGKTHVGHRLLSSVKKILPRKARHILNNARYGRVRASINRRLFGNNSAQSVSVYSGDVGSGYQYNGRSISELM